LGGVGPTRFHADLIILARLALTLHRDPLREGL